MNGWEKLVLGVHIDKIGKMAIVECEGRIVRSESAFRLREAVISQLDARIIVIDLSEVTAVEQPELNGMIKGPSQQKYQHAQTATFTRSRLIRFLRPLPGG